MQRVLPCVSLVLVITSLLLVWAGGVTRPYVQNDFSYSADLTTTTNLYDTSNQRYTGDRYSNGHLYYQLVGSNNGVATIRSVWQTTSVTDGTTIAKGTQQYQVKTANGAAATGADREFLFAPRNLQTDERFIYRYPAYSEPATMRYAGQENLDGLRVFRYTATFPADVQLAGRNVTPDQLPAGAGLAYHPHLAVWVEPTTGWLVKFDDSGSVTSYDRTTGKTTGPHGTYTVHFTDASVLQQVAYARSLKDWDMVVRRAVPATIITILWAVALVLLLWQLRAVSVLLRWLMGIAYSMCGVVLIGWAVHSMPFAHLFLGDAGLHPLAALCFVAAALCILCMQQNRYRVLRFLLAASVLGVGVWALLLRTHTLLVTLTLVPQGSAIDTVTRGSTSQISAYAACTLIVLGIALCKAAYADHHRPVVLRVAAFMAAMVVSLGFTALLLQLLQVDSAFALSLAYPLSGATSFLSLLSGYMLLLVIQSQRGVPLAARPLIRQLLVPALLSIPLIVIGSVAQAKQNELQAQFEASFVSDTTRIEDAAKSKLATYLNVLSGVQALFASSHQVEPGEWQTFVRAYTAGQSFPGMRSVGYAAVLQPGQVAAFVQAQKATTPSYGLYPASQLTTRTPVTYIEPQTAAQQKLLGYDMFTNAADSEAMAEARDTDKPTITSQAQPGTTQQPQALLFLPIYQNGKPTDSMAERQAAISGYVFVTLSWSAVAYATLGNHPYSVDYQLFDGTQADSEVLLYDSRTASHEAAYAAPLTESSTFYFAGHPLTLVYRAQPSFRVTGAGQHAPAIIMLAGGLAYACGLVAFSFMRAYRDQTMQLASRVRGLRKRSTKGRDR